MTNAKKNKHEKLQYGINRAVAKISASVLSSGKIDNERRNIALTTA